MPRRPKRIQRKRTKGWRMPEGAVYVGRPTVWGNPFRARRNGEGVVDPEGRLVAINGEAILAAADWPPYEFLAAAFDAWISAPAQASLRDDIRRELAGRDLVCWCPLDQACHADVLLEIANCAPSASRL